MPILMLKGMPTMIPNVKGIGQSPRFRAGMFLLSIVLVHESSRSVVNT